MTISAGRISAIAVASVLFFQTAYAEDSERLLELRANPPISAEAIQQEQSLSARYEELQGALKQKDLSKEDKKALKAELKTVKSELKSIQKPTRRPARTTTRKWRSLRKTFGKPTAWARILRIPDCMLKAVRSLCSLITAAFSLKVSVMRC